MLNMYEEAFRKLFKIQNVEKADLRRSRDQETDEVD